LKNGTILQLAYIADGDSVVLLCLFHVMSIPVKEK
jgi:hypothetical protein